MLGTIVFIALFSFAAGLIIAFKELHDFKNASTRNGNHEARTDPSKSISTTSHNYAKQIQPPQSYSVLHNDSPFSDNLNYKRYEYKALFVKTNRMRTRKIEAFTEAEAIDNIKSLGYAEPITITQIPFDPPTENQIETCRKHGTSIPSKACDIDVSYIISKDMDNDTTPNPELLRFATEMKIQLSYYIGKKKLYSYIFSSLELKDKIAFFAFCVYRFLSNDRCGNLNNSPLKDYFYQFANNKLADKSFTNSMNRYTGDQLRYFGILRVENYEYSGGGSNNTIAYKDVKNFLQTEHLI